jgi:hypothetical protein
MSYREYIKEVYLNNEKNYYSYTLNYSNRLTVHR